MGRVGFLFIGICVLLAIGADGVTDPSNLAALSVLYGNVNSPAQLTGWSSSQQGDPCGQGWKGVTCIGSSVTELHLENLGLTGSLSYNLNLLTSLTLLNMSGNNLNGAIPNQLPPNLITLDLTGNQFNGGLPDSIFNLASLKYLIVGRNQLNGPLSEMFSKLLHLTTIDLSQNSFTGNIPNAFSGLTSLTSLYLQNNRFTGTIDVLAGLPLQNLNIENNMFSGWIPSQLRNINIRSGGNQWNSGPPPPSFTSPPPFPIPTPPPFATPPPENSGQGNNNNGGGGNQGGSRFSAARIACIVLAVLLVASMMAFFLIRKKAKRSVRFKKPEHSQVVVPLTSTESADSISAQSSSDPVVVLQIEPPSSDIVTQPPNALLESTNGDDLTSQPITKITSTLNIKATPYTIADLQMVTGSFSTDNLIGEGSIGRVYKAQFHDGRVLAVKTVNLLHASKQSSEDFLKLVSDMSQLHHPNVAELVGYCCEYGQYLLVYEFHLNGSLHDFLHLSDEYSKPLTWSTRVNIALGIARALEYLHEVCSPSIIHKEFKSANILLDAELHPRLSDCGLSRLAPDDYQVLDQYLSSGYSAPEVIMTGEYTLKSDVFSFGVVMLELLTGRKPFDSSRPRSEQSLVRWATPQLHDIDALDKMVDLALKGRYNAKSLSRFADAIALCVQAEPEFRPPMSEVVQALVRLVQRTKLSKRMSTFDDQDCSNNVDTQDMF